MSLIIGIDPDLEKSGVAMVRDGQIVDLECLDFFNLLKFIELYSGEAIFAVEDVEANRALYGKHNKQQQRVKEKISQNIGQVKAVSRLIEQWLKRLDCRYHMVTPLKGRFKQAKNDKAYFTRLTGWKGPSNADKRDAGLIALYGIKPGQYIPRPSEVSN